MVHITSLVMEKMQFNHFPTIWELSLQWQPNQEADHHNFSSFKLSLPKQHLYKISHTASVVLEEMSFKKNPFLKFNVAKATTQNGHRS